MRHLAGQPTPEPVLYGWHEAEPRLKSDCGMPHVPLVLERMLHWSGDEHCGSAPPAFHCVGSELQAGAESPVSMRQKSGQFWQLMDGVVWSFFGLFE